MCQAWGICADVQFLSAQNGVVSNRSLREETLMLSFQKEPLFASGQIVQLCSPLHTTHKLWLWMRQLKATDQALWSAQFNMTPLSQSIFLNTRTHTLLRCLSEWSQWTDARSAGIMALIAVSSVFNTVDDVIVTSFGLCAVPQLHVADGWFQKFAIEEFNLPSCLFICMWVEGGKHVLERVILLSKIQIQNVFVWSVKQ